MNPARRSSARCWLSAIVAASAAVGAARVGLALIDPTFTPLNLVHDATRIIAGRVQPADGDNWTLRDIRVLKGPETQSLKLSLGIAGPSDAREAREFMRTASGADAVLFLGEQTGYLLVADVWMDVKAGNGDALAITEFRNRRLPKTYTGSADKLILMAEYILSDDNADVPVAAGVKWRKCIPVGKVATPVSGLEALPGGNGVSGRLLVASTGGDRLFAYDRSAGRFDDRTKVAGLDTASRMFVLIDLNRDGLADLVSWDGSRLKVRLADKAGRFIASKDAVDHPLPGPCNALLPLSPGQDGAPGLLVDAGQPRLLAWTGTDWQDRPLPDGPDCDAPAEAAGRCMVADWDGDGYADILQVGEKAGRLWRGSKGGFLRPRPSEVIGGGLPLRWCMGDFDTDGRLDLVLCGDRTNELWENAGEKFRPVARHVESLYMMNPGAADCLAADLNHDGRPDIVVLSAAGVLDYHFNRGYRCLANEGDLKLDFRKSNPTQELRPMRLVAGDFDGDGGLDLAVACATGEVFCCLNDRSPKQPTPGIHIRLPAGHTGPVTVSVWQGEPFPVCVGTYSVQDHSRGVLAPLRTPGPCTLKWRWPGGPARSLVVDKPAETVLPMDTGP